MQPLNSGGKDIRKEWLSLKVLDRLSLLIWVEEHEYAGGKSPAAEIV